MTSYRIEAESTGGCVCSSPRSTTASLFHETLLRDALARVAIIAEELARDDTDVAYALAVDLEIDLKEGLLSTMLASQLPLRRRQRRPFAATA